MSGGQHPLGSDQGTTAQVLVQGVDQSHLPAPFAGRGIGPANYAALSVRALDTANVFIGDGVFQGGFDWSDLGSGNALIIVVIDIGIFPSADNFFPFNLDFLFLDFRLGRAAGGFGFFTLENVCHFGIACKQIEMEIGKVKQEN